MEANLSPFQVGRRHLGEKELGEGRTGDSGRGNPKEIEPPLCSGNGRLGEVPQGTRAWPALGECWAIKPMGANQRGRPNGRDISRAKTCRTKGRGQGPRGRRLRAGEMGEGDPTLLDPAFGLPSRARKGPLCVSARGRHACWGRPCYAPWAKLGASQATLPDYKSRCQLAASSKLSSLSRPFM